MLLMVITRQLSLRAPPDMLTFHPGAPDPPPAMLPVYLPSHVRPFRCTQWHHFALTLLCPSPLAWKGNGWSTL
jgi:hypothetical protein